MCTIQISVTDTGIGVSEEQQTRLFKPFQQAETSTTRKFGGTGLGLAISKNIVEKMDGRIWVESELGHGSTFAFTASLERGSDERRDQPKQRAGWDNFRFLAVDDSPDVLEYFEEYAQMVGAACDTAPSGEDACEIIEKYGIGVYDICFVDWKMPGMNGMELTRRIKAEGGEKPTVVMISSTDWNSLEKEGKRSGVDKYLSKPLFPSMITDCINECFGIDSNTGDLDIGSADGEDFSGHCVLLAEDIEINREIVQALLEPTNLKIEFAENGLEAVRMFTENPDRYDMILMDVQMPEMDGYDASRNIRALDTPNAASVPIIAMTANVFREDIEKCLAVGMNGHLGKPLDIDEVLSTLKQYIGS
jgi:CheY-like chemotaxis protein